ncbi:hypothetical protein BSY18_4001 (plasmid) [Blastomonas sp. RAC04]|nr:hypothetical protein BSY18_4001 [Blastomonas sp. RAC04]
MPDYDLGDGFPGQGDHCWHPGISQLHIKLAWKHSLWSLDRLDSSAPGSGRNLQTTLLTVSFQTDPGLQSVWPNTEMPVQPLPCSRREPDEFAAPIGGVGLTQDQICIAQLPDEAQSTAHRQT